MGIFRRIYFAKICHESAQLSVADKRNVYLLLGRLLNKKVSYHDLPFPACLVASVQVATIDYRQQMYLLHISPGSLIGPTNTLQLDFIIKQANSENLCPSPLLFNYTNII